MATLKSIKRPDIGRASGSEDERRDIAATAAAEIHSLADIVIDRMNPDDDGRALQSILRRIKRLTCVQLSALTDTVDDAASIRARLDELPEAHHG